MDAETITTLLFALLFGLVIVWFVLIKLLFNRLERAPPKNMRQRADLHYFSETTLLLAGLLSSSFFVKTDRAKHET